MPDDDDLAQRLTTLEEEVSRLRVESRSATVARADASAASTLASGAYEEVGEVRTKLDAHTRTLNALRETQVEQGDRLTALETKVDGLQTKVEGDFAKVHTGLAHITALLTNLADEGNGGDSLGER